MILRSIRLREGVTPTSAGRQSPDRWSIRVRKRSLNDRWKLGERPRPLFVLPLLTSASAIGKIQLVEHMLYRRQDGPAQQPGGLILTDVDHDQFGQHRLRFPEDVEALVKGALSLLLSLLDFGKNQAAERSNAVSHIVQNDSKRVPQLLTVGIIGPVLGGKLSKQHDEECPNRQLTTFQRMKSSGEDWLDVCGSDRPRIEAATVLQRRDGLGRRSESSRGTAYAVEPVLYLFASDGSLGQRSAGSVERCGRCFSDVDDGSACPSGRQRGRVDEIERYAYAGADQGVPYSDLGSDIRTGHSEDQHGADRRLHCLLTEPEDLAEQE